MNREQKQSFYELAGSLNNYPQNIHSDKVTIMAFMDTEEEVVGHVLRMAERVSSEVKNQTQEKIKEILIKKAV